MTRRQKSKRLSNFQKKKSFARTVKTLIALSGYILTTTPKTVRKKVTIKAKVARLVIKAPVKSIMRRCLLLFLNMKNGVLKNPKRSPRSIKKLPAIPIVIRIAVDS